MSEKDFVFAFVLATRASGGGTLWGRDYLDSIIDGAKQVYNQIQERCDETDSRTED